MTTATAPARALALVWGAVICLHAAQNRPATAPFIEARGPAAIDFVHVNGATGEWLLPEVIGSGGALLDYDNDGDLDVLAVQGGPLSTAPGANVPRSRLFRNDLASDRTFRFVDVTERSGLLASGYGMGAATGDIDNDGWVDVYLTYLGSNRLFRNQRDGTFADVTVTSAADDRRWSTSATFFDYDRDGFLDLFVANYVNFSLEMKRTCFSAGSARDYCNPSVYAPAADALFRNNGNGTFTNVTGRARIGAAEGRGLGLLAGDFNDDGWTDVYVANDGDANQLWINEGGRAFRDDALLAGVAVNRHGQPQGSMGVDAGDVDGDGDEDLFVTNLDNEGNTFYRNVGGGLFEDRSTESGLYTLGFTGFGTRIVDYDNDGWLDVVVVNGAVRQVFSQARRGDPYPLRQRNQLFHNERGRKFRDVTDDAGDAFALQHVARGAATGDLDNDGDTDLVVFNNNGPLRVLVNSVGNRRHWLGVRALDARYRRDAVQARVTVVGRGQSQLTRRVQTDGSYLSAGDPRVVFGLGDDATPRTVRVRWPGGAVEEFAGLAVDRYWLLESGKPPRTVGTR